MDDLQSRRDLAEAFENVVTKLGEADAEARARRLAPPTARQRKLWPILIVTWIGIAWVWIARPAALFGPAERKQLTSAEVDALARNALYLQRARIEQFRAEHGRLPKLLPEAGDVEEGVGYVRTPPEFLVETRAGLPQPLSLSSRMNADSFLGDALGRLPRPVTQ